MQHTAWPRRPKLGTWLALFAVVVLILSGSVLPGARPRPRGRWPARTSRRSSARPMGPPAS